MRECYNAEFARNIALECDTKITGGYRGRAVYIPYRSVDALTIDAENSAILKAVSLKESAKCVAINNASAAQPMSGSTTTGSNENGTIPRAVSSSLRRTTSEVSARLRCSVSRRQPRLTRPPSPAMSTPMAVLGQCQSDAQSMRQSAISLPPTTIPPRQRLTSYTIRRASDRFRQQCRNFRPIST